MSEKDIEAGTIVTLAGGLVHATGTPETWGERASAAIVFDTYEQAERALRALALHGLKGPEDDE